MNPRLLEAAADEIARLDSLATVAAPAGQRALEVDLIARLAYATDAQAIADARVALAAAAVDPVHTAALDPLLAKWRKVVERESRLLASGVPLTPERVHAMAADADAAVHDHAALDAALLPGGQPRSVLLRAVDCARALGVGPIADLAPCLLLVSGGLCAQPTFLPFAEVPLEARNAPDDDFADLLLTDAADAARARRLGLRDALREVRKDESLLSPLGRAAITARQALALLREELVTSVPSLSDRLNCSRPAAGDALERLVGVGLATEITGRGRDRVFADALAWDALP